MKRDIVPLSALLIFTAIFAGFAWLTHHPEAEILREAQDWPFVGPAATKFRELYIPPSPNPSSGSTDAAFSVEGADGFADGFRTEEAAEPWHEWETDVVEPYRRLWVIPDIILRETPSENAEELYRFTTMEPVRRLEDRPPWYRISWEDHSGWIRLENPPEGDAPTYGRRAAPVLALEDTEPDPETLERTLNALGEHRVMEIAGHTLYTDVDGERLLAHLSNVTRHVAAAYQERYGLKLGRQDGGAIVLFQKEKDYRLLQEESPRLAGRSIAGHAQGDVTTLYVGSAPRWRVASTLVHEMTHFYNRRAIGPALPPWLDEGLADDLGMSEVDGEGRLRLATVGGSFQKSGSYREVAGALASLAVLRKAVRDRNLPSLQKVLNYDWYEFVDPKDAGLHYAFSAFWVRYLLDGKEPSDRQIFLDWLKEISQGGPVDAESLRSALGESWPVLDARFRVWLQFHMAGFDLIDEGF